MNMDKYTKEKKITAHGVSELSDFVGASSGVPGSARWSSCDWTNERRRVGPRATSHSDRVTGDQSQAASDGESGRARTDSTDKPTKRIVGANDSPIRVETEEISIILLGKKDKTKGVDPFKLGWNLARSSVDEKREGRASEAKLDMAVESFETKGTVYG
jgi:hypothetical protein